MGIIAFAGLLICLFGVLVLSVACAWLIKHTAKTQSPERKFLILVVSMFMLVVTIWLAYNYSNIDMQQKIDSASRDCGWRVYKSPVDVEGVYLEDEKTAFFGSINDVYLPVYSQIEYLDDQGKVRRKFVTGAKEELSDKRAFRYGFRRAHANLPHRLIRHSTTLLDFDKNEVLAEDVSYEIDDSQSPDFKTLMFFFVTYHPQACGWASATEHKRRHQSVLRPKPIPN